MLGNERVADLPKLVLDGKEGRTYHLVPQLEFPVQSVEFATVGAFQSVFCQAYIADQEFRQPPSQVPISLRQWQQYGLDYDQKTCDGWYTVEPAPLSESDFTSNVPALLVNGEYNAYTTSKFTQEMAKKRGSAEYVELKQLGWVDWSEPCATELALAFLKDPSSGLDASCTKEIPPVEFILPLK